MGNDKLKFFAFDTYKETKIFDFKTNVRSHVYVFKGLFNGN